jgi:hypothetical protein
MLGDAAVEGAASAASSGSEASTSGSGFTAATVGGTRRPWKSTRGAEVGRGRGGGVDIEEGIAVGGDSVSVFTTGEMHGLTSLPVKSTDKTGVDATSCGAALGDGVELEADVVGDGIRDRARFARCSPEAISSFTDGDEGARSMTILPV